MQISIYDIVILVTWIEFAYFLKKIKFPESNWHPWHWFYIRNGQKTNFHKVNFFCYFHGKLWKFISLESCIFFSQRYTTHFSMTKEKEIVRILSLFYLHIDVTPNLIHAQIIPLISTSKIFQLSEYWESIQLMSVHLILAQFIKLNSWHSFNFLKISVYS